MHTGTFLLTKRPGQGSIALLIRLTRLETASAINSWQQLATAGNSWQQLATAGNSWQQLATPYCPNLLIGYQQTVDSL
jgi:hypothetical protein